MQACQGLRELTHHEEPNQSTDDIPASDDLDSATGPSTTDAVMMIDAKRANSGTDDKQNVHIELQHENMTLLMSTRYGSYAHRNHFLPAFAKAIDRAEEDTSLHDMFLAAATQMSQHPESSYQQQNPEYRTTNRKKLVFGTQNDGKWQRLNRYQQYNTSRACIIL